MSTCVVCGKGDDDTRMGVCWDCACAAEERAAKRSVVGHVMNGLGKVLRGEGQFAEYDFKWAWERFTKTGDYAPGGEFDSAGYDWR